jgi:branched-chain amino acid transport system ATP-binding protein
MIEEVTGVLCGTMLQVNNIEVVYNDVILVLKGISLEVSGGAAVALLGANGAGKTTTLKAVSGLIRMQNGELEGGSIVFEGRPIHKLDPDHIARLGISMVPEGRRIFSDLTVKENLMAGALTRADREAVRADLQKVFEYFGILTQRIDQRAVYLSGGEQQMVAVGRALMSRPRLIMLDEPSLGLAPLVVRNIFQILRRINTEQGTAMLLVEQNARLALAFASYGYIMENGRIVLDGPCSRLSQNQDVQEFYLGVTEASDRKSYAEVKHYKRRKRWLS